MGNKKKPGTFAFGSAEWPGLAKLNEECGEVGQIIGKLMQTDGEAEHWSGDLRVKLVEEVGDVAAAINFVAEHCFTKAERRALVKRCDMKIAKFQGWHEENK